MAKGENTYSILLFLAITFQSCCHQKEIVSADNKVDGVAVPKTLPGTAAMGPSTFRAMAEVLKVTKSPDEAAGKEVVKAEIVIREITGRGSSLIEIVTAGDTITCYWGTYRENDKQLTENIANKKLMEAVIDERPGRGPGNGTSFNIQSYRFK